MKINDVIYCANIFSQFLVKHVELFDLTVHHFDRVFSEEANNPKLNITLAKKSGIYLFSSLKNEVWYIGKAASDNLAAEIWSKFNTRSIPFNHKWKNDNSILEPIKEALSDGVFHLTIIEILPKDLCSLFEVYLQTFHRLKEKKLPKLNKRIG